MLLLFFALAGFVRTPAISKSVPESETRPSKVTPDSSGLPAYKIFIIIILLYRFIF